MEDATLKKTWLAEMIGVSYATILNILHNHLDMSKLSGKWLLKLFLPMQKRYRVDMSFFGDLWRWSWSNFCTSLYWRWNVGSSLSTRAKQMLVIPLKKCKVIGSAGKVMVITFWDMAGILLMEYKEKGVSITGAYYAEISRRLKEVIKENNRWKLSKSILFLHDNTIKCRVAMAAGSTKWTIPI